MDVSPYPNKMSDKEYLDAQWGLIEEDVTNFDPQFYDKLLEAGE